MKKAEQQAEENKKPSKLWVKIIIYTILIIFSAVIFVVLYQNTMGKKESMDFDQERQLKAGIGEELKYAEITAICGNEITINFLEDKASYEPTGETKTMLIPVGTDVTTKLGTVTTFSRLAAGDVIEILFQKDTDNILEICIVE